MNFKAADRARRFLDCLHKLEIATWEDIVDVEMAILTGEVDESGRTDGSDQES
jgi:hypothetical protein